MVDPMMAGPSPDEAAAMEMMLGDPAFGGEGGGDEVTCQVCRTLIDAASGEPLQPVGPEAVDNARMFATEAGAAEMGGQVLDVGPPGAGPPMM